MFTELDVKSVDSYVTPANIARLIQTGDTVMLCVDNHAARKLAHLRHGANCPYCRSHIVSTGEAIGALRISISALFVPIIVAMIVMTAFCVMVYFIIRKGGNLFFSRKAAV